ncbi:MAG: hypothetical protein R2714_17460 [Microthrixaceae bacterium]
MGGDVVTNPYEFSWAQAQFPFLRGDGPEWFGRRLWDGYRLPFCTANDRRRLDMARVGGLGEMPFQDDVAGDRVGLPHAQVPWTGNMTHAVGSPIQRTHPTNRVKVIETQYGDVKTSWVPAPADGYLWVEGHPFPASRMSTDPAQDLHARIIGANGETWEMNGAVPHYDQWGGLNAITCLNLARYDLNGKLRDGDRHVVRGNIQATALLLGRAEPMHRLGLAIRGDDRDPDSQPLNQWVGLDPMSVPWGDLTPDAHRVAAMLATHGAVSFDHGGVTGLGCVAGADWVGVNFGGWAPRLSDFRMVATTA